MKKRDIIDSLIRENRPKVEKLAICYPWASPFSWTMFMENALNLQRPKNSRWIRGVGWCPARRHIDMCEKAVDWGATHILILGSDQVHPEDMIPRLIKRVEEDGCEVISALVPTRGYIPWMGMKPFQPIAWRFNRVAGKEIFNKKPPQFNGCRENREMMEIINIEEGDLQKIDFIGSGVLMFPVDTLLALDKPWFDEAFVPKNYRRVASMDTRFVFNLKVQGGAQVWCDTTIKVGHLNIFEIDRTYSERFPDWTDLEYGECRQKKKNFTSQF